MSALVTVLVVSHVLGLVAAVHAVMSTRTAQGAIAWAISLITFPYIAFIAYLFFGRSRFRGYVDARKRGDLEIRRVAVEAAERAREHIIDLGEGDEAEKALERLARMPAMRRNRAWLLIDGDATFDAIFEAIDQAREYILIQFFIVHDDALGKRLKAKLVEKARGGVRIYFLFDELGSRKLPRAYKEELRREGIEIYPFGTTRGLLNRFQINFRNHRKIVVADGRAAFVGGLNVGDEYMGLDPKFGAWRDTHVGVEGPAVLGVQVSFMEDWYWATHRIPELNWDPRPSDSEDVEVLVVPSSPADRVETVSLLFTHLIGLARQRCWIASPYFVPDQAVMAALHLAELRGVDVRILIPDRPDHLLVYLNGFAYFGDMIDTGVEFHRYKEGFLHQKAILIDDRLAAVGTANLDNRSFRLNFELTLLFWDSGFVREVERMFLRDFARSQMMERKDLDSRSFWFKLGVAFARLTSPVQ